MHPLSAMSRRGGTVARSGRRVVWHAEKQALNGCSGLGAAFCGGTGQDVMSVMLALGGGLAQSFADTGTTANKVGGIVSDGGATMDEICRRRTASASEGASSADVATLLAEERARSQQAITAAQNQQQLAMQQQMAMQQQGGLTKNQMYIGGAVVGGVLLLLILK